MEISLKNMYVDLDSLHVRESKTVFDSGFHAEDFRFHLMDSRSLTKELGF